MWIGLFAIYALVFMALTLRRPLWALAAVFCVAPITSTINAGPIKMSLADLNAVLAFPSFVVAVHRSRGGLHLGPTIFPIGLYLGLCILSSLITYHGADSVISIAQMALYMIYIPLLFAMVCPPTACLRIFYLVLPIGVAWAFIGYFFDFNFGGARKNAFGAAYAAVLLVGYDLLLSRSQVRLQNVRDIYRHRMGTLAVAAAVLILGAALVLTVSRGAWLGAGLGLLAIIALRGAWRTASRHLLYALPVALVAWSLLPPQVQAYAFGFEADRWNIRMRYRALGIAQEYFYQDPLMGSGVGLRKLYDATNLFWSTLAESGVVGGAAFFAIFIVFFGWAWNNRRALPVTDPRYSLLTIGVALMIVKFAHGMVDHYWSRGPITMAWAGLGLVILYYRVFAVEYARALRQMASRQAALQRMAWQRRKESPLLAGPPDSVQNNASSHSQNQNRGESQPRMALTSESETVGG